jgi:hypothetical protein
VQTQRYSGNGVSVCYAGERAFQRVIVSIGVEWFVSKIDRPRSRPSMTA